MRISSSVTLSAEAWGSIPNSRTITFVDTESNRTNGRMKAATPRKIPIVAKEIASAFCIAMRLGTSSPKTKEKYDIISVIKTTLAT